MLLDSNEFQETNSLENYWLVLRRRWLIATIVTSLVVGATTVATLLAKPVYLAEGKLLLVKKDRASSLTDLTNKNKEISGLTQAVNPLETEAEIIRAGPLIERTIADLDLRNSERQPLSFEDFLTQLQVKGIKETDILSISYQSDDPKQAADVVNVLTSHYLDNNVHVSRAEANSAQQFIAKQLPEVEQWVARSEAALREFKENNQIVALDEEAKTSVSDLSKLSDQINQFQAALADVTAQSRALQQELGLTSEQAIALTSLNQSPAVTSILSEYRQLQDQLVLERTLYTSEHPTIIRLERQEVALSNQLARRVEDIVGVNQFMPEQELYLSDLEQKLAEDLIKLEVERLGLEDRVTVLDNAKLSYQARAGILPQLEQQQRALERHLGVAQSTYQQLLTRHQEVSLATNQDFGNAQVVAAASIPETPISPKILLNLFMGLLFGTLAGFLTALVLDSLDTSVKTVEKAEKLMDYPLLGVIALLEGKNYGQSWFSIPFLPTIHDSDPSVGTNFEMLRTTLGFTSSDDPLRTVLVTSAVPGEGKSFIAANLAVAAAKMGQRVLLVDADMRAPCQHAIWQHINLHGLSDILVGQATFEDSLKPSAENLDVVVAGTLPPNPIALLDSNRLSSLVGLMAADYDLVIFDTPALTFAPDALTLGKFVDGVLFVLRPSVVDSQSAERAKTLLSQAGHKVLGMVVNGSIVKQPRKLTSYSVHNELQNLKVPALVTLDESE